MTPLPIIRQELANTGYAAEAIVSNYAFADVLAERPEDRRVALAAFTQTPPSYRNAALGVVATDGRDPGTVVSEHRALGAPLLFTVDQNDVAVWQVRSDSRPRQIERVRADELPTLFSKNRALWSPQSIHRAKSVGQVDRTYQLDFVDIGLMPAIEGEIHAKLDRLLGETLADTSSAIGRRPRANLDERAIFRTTFRLLAAKVLQDRSHELATRWDPDDIETVLDTISQYYKLSKIPAERTDVLRVVFAPAWDRLRRAINFANISADDLAYVYENTLVTPETRKHFGTHSTPRQVAEYIVNRLELWRHDPEHIRVYEPFVGAGVFLVAAVRRLRDSLPLEWTDRQRHDFLVERIGGDEKDTFACEVATLSLILADYPNANGWRIEETDLFKSDRLAERARQFNVVLCNPPFQSFTTEERQLYAKAAARSHARPIATLDAVLDAKPMSIGFVMPHPFIFGKQYAKQRRRVEELYREIELVSLPDQIFKASVVRSALLIARDPRVPALERPVTRLKATDVAQRDRDQFLRSGKVTETRAVTRPFLSPTADLWVGKLDALWRYVAEYQKLGEVAAVHRGIEWKGDQAAAVSTYRRPGDKRGLHGASSVHQFVHDQPRWLDMRPQGLRRAIGIDWSSPKLLVNASRLSRGAWCIAAVVDRAGLVASQQIYGVWVRHKGEIAIESLCSVINSPIANAYAAIHSPPDRIRASALRDLPLPLTWPTRLSELVDAYLRIVADRDGLFRNIGEDHARALLDEIDATVLRAYDLPPRLEKELLEFFRGSERPTVHPWRHWFPEDFRPCVPLHEYLSSDYKRLAGTWPVDVFSPLPEDEAALLRDALE